LAIFRNLFVLPYSCHRRSPFKELLNFVADYTPTSTRCLFSASATKHLRHISMAFDSRSEETMSMTHSVWTEVEAGQSGHTFDSLSREQRLDINHTLSLAQLANDRKWMWFAVG
jgi:hypothetical protein